MAEIEMERRPPRKTWTWVFLLLVLAAVAFGAWLAFGGNIDVGGDTVRETTEVAPDLGPEPAAPVGERRAPETERRPADTDVEGARPPTPTQDGSSSPPPGG